MGGSLQANCKMDELLRLAAFSQEYGAFHASAACIALRGQQQRLEKSSGSEAARDVLLASLLRLLETIIISKSETAAPTFCEGCASSCACGGGEGGGGRGGRDQGRGVGGRKTVWQLSSELVGEYNPKTWQSLALGGIYRLLTCSCQLVSAALLVGHCSAVLQVGETLNHFLKQVHARFWSHQMSRFAKQVGPVDNLPTDSSALINGWCTCIVLLHVIQEMHETLTSTLRRETGLTSLASQGGAHGSETETSVTDTTEICKLFLCEDVSCPLASKVARSAPQLLHSLYLQWWSFDFGILKNKLEIPMVNNEGVGLVLKSGRQLSSALVLLGTVLGPWNGMESVQQCCSETVLRLANLHWRNLTEVTGMAPDQLPPKLWYVVINSAICLHSTLTRLQSILKPTQEYALLFSQLLHTLTEFTNTLTHHTISYHTRLLRFSLLHDADSHNWSDHRPFSEGERCSLTVQMWHYHLRGLHDDLWEVGRGGGGGGGGEVMIRILTDVIADSLVFLEKRYSRAQPSYGRVNQFQADILVVLVGVAFFLPHISTPSPHHSVTNLTASCLSLAHTLAVVAAPLGQLLSSLHTHLLPPSHTHPLPPSHTHPLPPSQSYKWLEHLNLAHFGIPVTTNQNTEDDLIRNFQNFVSLPYPSWTLLIKILLARDGWLPSLLVRVAELKQKQSQDQESEERLLTFHLCQILSHCVCQPQALWKFMLPLHLRGQTCKHGTTGGECASKKHFRNLNCHEWLIQVLKNRLQWCVARWAGGMAVWETGEGGTGVSGAGGTGVSGEGGTGVSGAGGTGVSGEGGTGVSGEGETGVSGEGGTGVSGEGETGVSGEGEIGVSGEAQPLTGSVDVSGSPAPTTSASASMVTEHLLSILDTLECALSALPSPVTFTLSQLATDKSSTGGSGGLLELLATLLPDWLGSLPRSLSPALLSPLSLSFSLVSWTLNGAQVNTIESSNAFSPSIHKALKEGAPLIKRRLQTFGASLPGFTMTTTGPSSIPQYGVELGHKVMADLLQNHPEAQESLHYIYHWTFLRKDYIMKLTKLPSSDQSEPLPSPPEISPIKRGFDPLEVGVSLGNGAFDHQWLLEPSNLPWKEMLDLSLPLLSRENLVRLVGNRFEFQTDSQLQDNEPDHVRDIHSMLRHDNQPSP